MRFSILLFLPIFHAESCYPSPRTSIQNVIPPCSNSKPLILYKPYLRHYRIKDEEHLRSIHFEEEEEVKEDIEYIEIDT